MPAPLYGADDPRRCSGNSVSEVLDKFRKNYDLIMSLPQETKEEKEFRHCIWLAEKEERERIYQTSIRPFRKATYDRLIITKGYPKRDDSSRRIDVPYGGYEIKTITHPHFGDKPVKVFAIKVNIGNK